MEGFITEYPDLEKYPKVATSFNSMSLCGYVQRTTFWDDFTSADKKGVGGIEDIFRQAFESRGNDVVFLTELTLVTNWKRGTEGALSPPHIADVGKGSSTIVRSISRTGHSYISLRHFGKIAWVGGE